MYITVDNLYYPLLYDVDKKHTHFPIFGLQDPCHLKSRVHVYLCMFTPLRKCSPPDSDVLRERSPSFPWLRTASSWPWWSDMCVGFGGRGGGVAQKGLSNRNTSPGPRTGHDDNSLVPYGAPKGEGAESKDTTGLKTSSVTFSNELCSNERSEFDMLSHLKHKKS